MTDNPKVIYKQWSDGSWESQILVDMFRPEKGIMVDLGSYPSRGEATKAAHAWIRQNLFQ